ncbi:hypothetical protein F8M41_005865 [Gigaspora margarita]|uniref:Uncharacterized protein n=1 Tax=Gigaspora margarita TaxID=4874 RepID=A0A8H3XAF0_GIGMA|nr:hypothetical protein F8M41_005865 [Gigaspora margarita]
MSQVGYCYRNGIGTTIDMKQANYWFQMEKSKFHEIIRSEYNDLDIDDEIKELLDNDKYQLSWIPYDFENIEVIGKENSGDLDETNKQFLNIANDIYNKLGVLIKSIEYSCNSEIKKQLLCGDEDFIMLVNCFKFLKSTITQFFGDDIIINFKFDEWIKNLEISGDLDETKKQFLDKNSYSKESNDDHKYKSKYIQKDSNSLLIQLPE